MKRVYYIPLAGVGLVPLDLDTCRRVRPGSNVANYDPRVRLKAEWVYLTPAPDERLVAEISVSFTRGNNGYCSEFHQLDPAQIEQELAKDDPCTREDLDWGFLVALDDLEAWSHEDSRLRNIVLERAGIKLHPRNAALLVMIAKLKGEGLIKTSRGPTGGSWVTAKGRELVGIYRGGRLRLIR